MKKYLHILIFAVLCCSFAAESGAQTRRRRTQKKTSTVSRPQPTSSSRIIEPEVISTAESEIADENQNVGTVVLNSATGKPEKSSRRQNASSAQPTGQSNDNLRLQREVNTLRNEVKQLRDKRALEDMEKLSLAEERAENFRRKLDEALGREAELNSKMQELEYQSRSEIIERDTAGAGSLHPEEVRDARRKMLDSEKNRVREQLNQIQISRSRLEAAIVNADALVEKLRTRVNAENDENVRTGTSGVKSRDTEQTQEDSEEDERNP